MKIVTYSNTRKWCMMVISLAPLMSSFCIFVGDFVLSFLLSFLLTGKWWFDLLDLDLYSWFEQHQKRHLKSISVCSYIIILMSLWKSIVNKKITWFLYKKIRNKELVCSQLNGYLKCLKPNDISKVKI